jgi:hypothetical protein
MMVEYVTVVINDVTGMIIVVMSPAVFGIHPYAYL